MILVSVQACVFDHSSLAGEYYLVGGSTAPTLSLHSKLCLVSTQVTNAKEQFSVIGFLVSDCVSSLSEFCFIQYVVLMNVILCGILITLYAHLQ